MSLQENLWSLAPNKEGWGQQPNWVGGIKSCFLSTMHRGKLWNTKQILTHLPLLFLLLQVATKGAPLLPCTDDTHRASLSNRFPSSQTYSKCVEDTLCTHYSVLISPAAWSYVYLYWILILLCACCGSVDLVCVCVNEMGVGCVNMCDDCV